jgi:hypothetical protein
MPAYISTAADELTRRAGRIAVRSLSRPVALALIGTLTALALLGVPAAAPAITTTTTTLQISGIESHSANPAVVGQTTQLAAYVQDAAISHGETGTVTITSGSTVLCNAVTLGGDGYAKCWWYPTTAGTYHLQASYSGATGYSTSSGTLTVTVNANTPYPTTTTLSATNPFYAGDIAAGGRYVAIVRNSVLQPVGTVSFAEGPTTIPGCASVPLSGIDSNGAEAYCFVSYGTVGSHSVVASFSGGQDSLATVGVRFYPPSKSAAVTANVVRDAATVSLSAVAGGSFNATTVIPGEAVTFTADIHSVNRPTSLYLAGTTVGFTSGGATIPGCEAVPVTADQAWASFVDCTTTFSTVGSPQIVASFSGNTFKLPSSSAPFTEQVIVSPTSTALRSSANPTLINQTVTYSASVSSAVLLTPTGTVTFASGGAAIAGCAAVALSGGIATCSTTTPATAGTPQITATYNGATSYATSTSAALSEHVLASASATSTSLAVWPYAAVVGQSVTYAASVTSGVGLVSAGTVAFTNGAATIAGCASVAVSAGGASCSTSYTQPGSPQTTATYTGGARFAGSSSQAIAEQIAPVPTTISCKSTSFTDVFQAGGTEQVLSYAPSGPPTSWASVNATNGFIYSMALGGHGIAPDIYGCDYPRAVGAGLLSGSPSTPVSMIITGYSWNGGVNAPMTFTGIVTPATEALLMASASQPLIFQFALQGADPGSSNSAGDVLASGHPNLFQIPSQPGTPTLSTTLQSPTLVKTTTTTGGQPADVVQFTVPAPPNAKSTRRGEVTYAPCPHSAASGSCGYTWVLQWGGFSVPSVGGLLPTRHHHKTKHHKKLHAKHHHKPHAKHHRKAHAKHPSTRH